MGAVVPVPAETVAAARALWDEGALTATEIGLRVGLSKNSIVSLAYRRGWQRKAISPLAPTTMSQRLDAVDARFEAAIAEANATLDRDRARFRREREVWLTKQKRERAALKREKKYWSQNFEE